MTDIQTAIRFSGPTGTIQFEPQELGITVAGGLGPPVAPSGLRARMTSTRFRDDTGRHYADVTAVDARRVAAHIGRWLHGVARADAEICILVEDGTIGLFRHDPRPIKTPSGLTIVPPSTKPIYKAMMQISSESHEEIRLTEEDMWQIMDYCAAHTNA